jgi:flagellar hook-length control protein FliK
MNGLAMLLGPVGDMPEVLGTAGRSPDSGQTQTDADGFLGILQQMIGGSIQMAAAMSMLPVVAGSGTESTPSNGSTDSTIGTINLIADCSVKAEQPGNLTVVSASPPGPSPPDMLDADLPDPGSTTEQPSVAELNALPAQERQVTTEQQSAAKSATAQTQTAAAPPQTGAIELPGVVLAKEDERLAKELDLAQPAVPPKTEGPAVTKGDANAVKHAPISPSTTRQPGVVANAKPAPAGHVSSVGGHTDKPAAKQQPDVRESRSERDGNAGTTAKSQFGSMADLRAALEAGIVDATTGVKPEPGEQAETPRSAGSAETEVAGTDVPVSVKAEEMPARAVTSPKATVEMQPREDGAAKSMLTHAQQQINATRSTTGRSESATERLQQSLTSLPPETAKSVMDQVVKGAALQVRGDTSEMHIRLIPESLGEVTVSVRMEGGQMQAQIDVSHPSVKAALESNISQLREALNSHGIDVQRLDVCQYGQSMAGDNGGSQSNRSKRQNTRHHSYATDAIEQFDTGRLLGYNTIEVVM